MPTFCETKASSAIMDWCPRWRRPSISLAEAANPLSSRFMDRIAKNVTAAAFST